MFNRFYTVYVIECVDKHYYVGVTSDLKRRYQKHKLGTGAEFTKRHKPVKLFDSYPIGEMTIDEAEKYENARALEIIQVLGLARVRGGKYFSGNIKSKKLRRDYSLLDDKYKNISNRMPGRVRVRKQKKPQDPWSKQKSIARSQLARSSRLIR